MKNEEKIVYGVDVEASQLCDYQFYAQTPSYRTHKHTHTLRERERFTLINTSSATATFFGLNVCILR